LRSRHLPSHVIPPIVLVGLKSDDCKDSHLQRPLVRRLGGKLVDKVDDGECTTERELDPINGGVVFGPADGSGDIWPHEQKDRRYHSLRSGWSLSRGDSFSLLPPTRCFFNGFSTFGMLHKQVLHELKDVQWLV
jgi:hypothetical protein